MTEWDREMDRDPKGTIEKYQYGGRTSRLGDFLSEAWPALAWLVFFIILTIGHFAG